MKLVLHINTGLFGFIEDSELDTSKHVDRHKPIYLYRYGIDLSDYMYVVREIDKYVQANSVTINSDISDEEKCVLICTNAIDIDTDAIAFIMQYRSLSQEDAVNYIKLKRSEHITMLSSSFVGRIKSNAFKLTVLRYMDDMTASFFTVEVKNLVDLASLIGIIGKGYGNTVCGIMDYIDNTNDYIDADKGISKFNLENESGFQSESKSVLIDGVHLFNN